MSNILTAFNKHFGDFLDDVQNVFPNSVDILTAKNALNLIRKSNPKMLVNIWMKYIVTPYDEQIELGDISFFINKDYKNDLVNLKSSDTVMDSINRLRDPIRSMSPEDQEKTMKYIQNLSKLAKMYQSVTIL